jgi:hypothetical protein
MHNHQGISIMRIKLGCLTPLLAAGAAAAAIAAAPTAMAASAGPGCHMMGGSPVCPNTHSTLTSPPAGNSQVNASTGAVDPAPQYPYAEGGYWGGYGPGAYGGFGHGGFGGFGHGGFGGFGGFGHGGFGGGHGGGGGHGK